MLEAVDTTFSMEMRYEGLKTPGDGSSDGQATVTLTHVLPASAYSRNAFCHQSPTALRAERLTPKEGRVADVAPIEVAPVGEPSVGVVPVGVTLVGAAPVVDAPDGDVLVGDFPVTDAERE